MYTYKVTIFYNVDGYESPLSVYTTVQADSVDDAQEAIIDFLEAAGLPVGTLQIKRFGESF